MNGRLYMCKRYQFRLYDFSDYILVWYLIFILLYIVVVEREAGASEENPSTCYNSLTNLHKVISSTPRHGHYYPHKNIGTGYARCCYHEIIWIYGHEHDK